MEVETEFREEDRSQTQFGNEMTAKPKRNY
jgi:hypothetical protein